MRAKGGHTLYGHTIGIIVLDTRFPRIPGDIGNAITWPFPARYRVVSQASPERVVRQQAMHVAKNLVSQHPRGRRSCP